MSDHNMKSIWYFVGLILLVMGGIILLSGIGLLIYPPETKTVLSEIHPNLWWGGIMCVFGGGLYLKMRKPQQ